MRPTNWSSTDKKIASLLDIRFERGYELVAGDHLICEALHVAIRREDPNARDINPHIHAARHIRDAMPQALSIDNFIDAHRGEKRIELCGKLAIARSILQAERDSKLYVEPTVRSKNPNFNCLRETWFNSFFMLLTENCRTAPPFIEKSYPNGKDAVCLLVRRSRRSPTRSVSLRRWLETLQRHTN
jgi:hypothetical protein